MRTFDHFLRRRGVKDISMWLRNMSIKSDDELAAWCKSEDVQPPSTQYFEKPIIPAKPVATKSKLSTIDEGQEENWHIPAAERSRKAPAKVKSKSRTTSKSVSKSKPKNK